MTSPPAASPGFNVSARVSSAVPAAGDADAAVRLARTQRHAALCLAQRCLRCVPTEIAHGDSLDSVETLTLRMNMLSQLPEDFGKNLPNLAELYLHSNNLLSLPNALGSLTCLRVLDLSGNRLTSLPSSLGRLGSLTTLRLTHNHLQQLPPTLCLLPRLCTLDLASNALVTLPAASLPAALRRLSLDSNRLRSLPPALCRLPALTELTAAGNRLRSLPMDLGRSGKLQLLFVDRNPELSLLPSWLHSLTLGCVGCGTEVGLVTEVTLNSPGLPHEIRWVGSHVGSRVVPLVELALRALHPVWAQWPETFESESVSLLGSPTSHCPQCGAAIFTAAFPRLVAMRDTELAAVHGGRASLVSFVALCCSPHCARRFTLS